MLPIVLLQMLSDSKTTCRELLYKDLSSCRMKVEKIVPNWTRPKVGILKTFSQTFLLYEMTVC